MEWAELVLKYVDALAWPVVIAGVIWAFRKQIKAKIGDLKDASTPVASASFFDRGAREVEELADRAADRQEAKAAEEPQGEWLAEKEPEDSSPQAETGLPQTSQQPTQADELSTAAQAWLKREMRFRALSGSWLTLTTPPDFSTAKEVAPTSPEAAVLLAYADLEKVVNAAWTVDQMEGGSPTTVASAIQRLTHGGLSDFAQVGREIVQLQNSVAHGGATVTTAGALDFIVAIERLSDALIRVAVSKMRHPSRSRIVAQWVSWMEHGERSASDSSASPGN